MNISPKHTVTKIRQFKPNRTWVVLAVALVIGGLAALAARGYLNKQMASIEAKAKGKTVTVIVAKGDIAKGVKLSTENLALRAIPLEFSQSTAVSPEDVERIDGQVLAYPVKSGEMIMWGLMETQRARTFSARIENGRRAMTVPVDEINSISGMLEPGDSIDLMVTLDRAGKKFTFPVMQNVEVLATGQRSQDDPKGGETRQYTNVTIDSTATEAQWIIAAREGGKLTALLRNPGDKAPLDNKRYDVPGLLGLNGDAVVAGSGPRTVPVIYGGQSARMPPEALRLDGGRRAGVTEAEPGADAMPGAPAAAPAAPMAPLAPVR